VVSAAKEEYFTPMERKSQDTFDYSKNSASRKPNSSPPVLSSFAADITTPYVSRFLQFQHHIHSQAANRIYQRTSFVLLWERIHHNRRELDNTSQSQTFSRIIPQTCPQPVHSTRTYLPMKMEQTECSETSAYKIQMLGNHPKESIQQGVFGLKYVRKHIDKCTMEAVGIITWIKHVQKSFC